jgi:hypothetical protein
MAKNGSSEGEIAASYDLSPELVVIVKKLSKRDSTTKVRALEEFEAYLKANESSVFGILDTWVWRLCVVKYGKFLLYDHSFFSFAGSPIWEDGIGC